MQELSRLFRDRPITPQEAVVYWTEYVIRSKGAMRLRTTGADMPMYRYYFLDIICTIASSIILIILIVIYVLKSMYKFCFPRPITVDENTTKKKL